MADWGWTLIVFALHFIVLIGIVAYRSRRVANMGDYVLGGRKLGGFTTALSAGSSVASGWTMLVFPALAFAGGLMQLWTGVSVVVGIWLAWIVLAKRLRRYTITADNALTIPEFWEKRLGDTTGTLRGLAAAISLYFVTLYVCSALIAGAKLLGELFDLDPTGTGQNMAILITLVALLSYTFLGFVAVSRTDVFQALIMLGGLVIMAVALMLITANPFQGLENAAPGFWNPFTDAAGEPLGLVTYLSTLGWGLSAFGALRLLARFMALEDERQIRRSTYITVGWSGLVFSFGLLVGLVAAPALAARGVDIPDSERLYLVVSSAFFHPIVGGLLLTAVLAAIMSTADSQLLMASAIASGDTPWLRRIREGMRPGRQVTLGRLFLVAVGVVAAVISILSPESVATLVSLAWGGMGAAFGPVTVMALYWRRFNLAGAFTGVITGTVVATFWWLMDLGNQVVLDMTASLGLASAVSSLQESGVWEINPAGPGLAAATVLAIVVTLATAPPSEEVTRVFDEVNSPDWVDPTHSPAP